MKKLKDNFHFSITQTNPCIAMPCLAPFPPPTTTKKSKKNNPKSNNFIYLFYFIFLGMLANSLAWNDMRSDITRHRFLFYSQVGEWGPRMPSLCATRGDAIAGLRSSVLRCISGVSLCSVLSKLWARGFGYKGKSRAHLLLLEPSTIGPPQLPLGPMGLPFTSDMWYLFHNNHGVLNYKKILMRLEY